MNIHVRKIADKYGLANPNTILYHEVDEFSQDLINRVCKMINEHIQYNNPNDCLLVLSIKDYFGIEPN